MSEDQSFLLSQIHDANAMTPLDVTSGSYVGHKWLRQEWEYKEVEESWLRDGSGFFESRMNKLGEDGWELFHQRSQSYMRDGVLEGGQDVYTFKRPKAVGES